MSALDAHDLIAVAPDDLRNSKYGSKKPRARPFYGMHRNAGTPEHFRERRVWTAHEADRAAFARQTRQEVPEELLASSPAAEVIDKENVHMGP